MLKKIIAVGDCNTLGVGELKNNSYPERAARLIGAEVRNIGHTMATTREGLLLLRDNLDESDCVIIQFGLVDSYKTFKYSPYVLYYPDNILRKQVRSLAKKFKKTCRNTGLNQLIGEVNVVALEEYEANIRSMIELAAPRLVILLDTVPNRQLERNGEIQKYNALLTSLSNEYVHCVKINLFDLFAERLDTYYLDETHCNADGYTRIAEEIRDQLERYNTLPE